MYTIPYRLEITDGTTTLDLVHGNDTFYLDDWAPNAPGYKNDGIFQDSPLADGRKLVNRSFNNIVDTFAIRQSASKPNNNIYYRQELRRLLEKAADYQTTEWQNDPVYLVAQGPEETAVRYALVVAGNIPSTQNPYGSQWQYKFFGKSRANDAFSLVIEHGLWLSEPPESGTAVCLTNGSVFNSRIYGPEEGTLENVPYIYFYDDSATSFSANLATASLPTVLMPSGSTAGDLLYFGFSTPFDALSFTLSSGQNGTAETRWYYWSGSGWVELETADFIQDKTGTAGFPGAFSLQTSGNINWYTIAGWRETAVNGVNAYWMRMRLAGVPITANITVSSRVNLAPLGACQTYLPFVANHDKTANITNIYYYDNSLTAYSANRMDAVIPFSWSSSTYDANDIIYFGISTAVTGSGPFSGLIFNLGDTFAATAYTGAWQYWNGASWTALTVGDNTNGGTGPLEVPGENGVYWTPPANWAAVSVNGVTGWWVRLLISAATALTIPQQTTRHVYTPSWSFIEVPDETVLGDVRAAVRAKLYGQVSGALAKPNRILCGERSVVRGEDFRAFINLGNVQNPSGIVVSSSPLVTQADTAVATGLAAFVAASGGSTNVNIQVNFDDTIAWQYNGEFRLFLRAFTDDTAGYTVRAQLYDETGGLLFQSDPVVITDTGSYIFFDIGNLSIADLSGGFELFFVITASGTSDDLWLADFQLLPTDEYTFDSIIPATLLISTYYMQADGLGKRARATVHNTADDLKISGCRLSASAIPSVQSNKQTRLWFQFDDQILAQSAAGMYLQVGLEASQRYLSMRGDR